MPCSKKLILTGATGLIGREILAPLTAAGFDVYALTIDANNPQQQGVTWVNCNIFDSGKLQQVFEQIRPQYLLNLAWATTGDYLTNNINLDFLRAGNDLIKYFAQYGGQRAVYAGTCMEYAFKQTPLKEDDPLAPTTLYAQCKRQLFVEAGAYCEQHNISFGWGRIFYVYGRGEDKKRLTAFIADSLRQNQTVTIKHSHLIKDYVYTKDIAAAFAALLASDARGAVNICSGQGISLADYASTIADIIGKKDLLDLRQEECAQPPLIVGDNTRLTREVGFTPRYTLKDGLTEVLAE